MLTTFMLPKPFLVPLPTLKVGGDDVQQFLHILRHLSFREEFHLEDESGAFIHNLFVENCHGLRLYPFRDSYMLTDRQYLEGSDRYSSCSMFLSPSMAAFWLLPKEQCVRNEDLEASSCASEDSVSLLQVFQVVTDDAHE